MVGNAEKFTETGQIQLIVEDNIVNRMVVIGMLRKLGLPYEIAENGLQALGIFTQKPSKFVIVQMDCDMPIMDGYTATEKIREWEKLHAIVSTPIGFSIAQRCRFLTDYASVFSMHA